MLWELLHLVHLCLNRGIDRRISILVLVLPLDPQFLPLCRMSLAPLRLLLHQVLKYLQNDDTQSLRFIACAIVFPFFFLGPQLLFLLFRIVTRLTLTPSEVYVCMLLSTASPTLHQPLYRETHYPSSTVCPPLVHSFSWLCRSPLPQYMNISFKSNSFRMAYGV